MSAAFTYLRLIIGQGRPAQQALDARLKAITPRLEAAGGRVVGRFAAQLGWAANDTSILLQGVQSDEAMRAVRELIDHADIEESRIIDMDPTARPTAAEPLVLMAGGIYVHRWFTVQTPDLETFVDLSAKAWPDFEARFDAKIFSLFHANQTHTQTAFGHSRLLLLTRYGDHGVWEKSRDPTTEAMQIFAQRQLLTQHTIASSSLLVAG